MLLPSPKFILTHTHTHPSIAYREQKRTGLGWMRNVWKNYSFGNAASFLTQHGIISDDYTIFHNSRRVNLKFSV